MDRKYIIDNFDTVNEFGEELIVFQVNEKEIMIPVAKVVEKYSDVEEKTAEKLKEKNGSDKIGWNKFIDVWKENGWIE